MWAIKRLLMSALLGLTLARSSDAQTFMGLRLGSSKTEVAQRLQLSADATSDYRNAFAVDKLPEEYTGDANIDAAATQRHVYFDSSDRLWRIRIQYGPRQPDEALSMYSRLRETLGAKYSAIRIVEPSLKENVSLNDCDPDVRTFLVGHPIPRTAEVVNLILAGRGGVRLGQRLSVQLLCGLIDEYYVRFSALNNEQIGLIFLNDATTLGSTVFEALLVPPSETAESVRKQNLRKASF